MPALVRVIAAGDPASKAAFGGHLFPPGPAVVDTIEIGPNTAIDFTYDRIRDCYGVALFRTEKHVAHVTFENYDNDHLKSALVRFAFSTYEQTEIDKASQKPKVGGYIVMDKVIGDHSSSVIFGFRAKDLSPGMIFSSGHGSKIAHISQRFDTKYMHLAFARFALGAYPIVDEEEALEVTGTFRAPEVKLPTAKDFD